MHRIVAMVLIVLWLLGLVAGFTLGSFIHVLLVLAIVVELIRIDESGESIMAGSEMEE